MNPEVMLVAQSVGETFQQTVASGPIFLALGAAILAGLVSFASPCVIPLVPGYLAYLASVVGADRPPVTAAAAERQRAATATLTVEERRTRRSSRNRVVMASLLFVAGFTVVFMLLGGFAGAVGYLLQEYAVWINRVAGVIVILMGLLFIGVFPQLSGTRKVSSKRPDAGLLGAPLMGLVFGLSWTPCIGPTYAAIIALSLDGGAGSGAAVRGGILALAYSLGLGLPFVLFALLFERALGLSRALSRHRRTIGLLSGALLVVIGVLLLTGQWAAWMNQLQGMISTFEPVV